MRRRSAGMRRSFVLFYQTVQITFCNALENQTDIQLYDALYTDAHRKFARPDDFFAAEYVPLRPPLERTPAARPNRNLYRQATLAN